MIGTGRLRWFGPFLASRISNKVFINRIGTVEVADWNTCSDSERTWLSDASSWARGIEVR